MLVTTWLAVTLYLPRSEQEGYETYKPNVDQQAMPSTAIDFGAWRDSRSERIRMRFAR